MNDRNQDSIKTLMNTLQKITEDRTYIAPTEELAGKFSAAQSAIAEEMSLRRRNRDISEYNKQFNQSVL
ncbi:MAG: hypothetical protein FWE47_01150 [Oscillospiraceae bacterium]|nr:hypothetical protein [Oscillospiraceae bacterium]